MSAKLLVFKRNFTRQNENIRPFEESLCEIVVRVMDCEFDNGIMKREAFQLQTKREYD